MGHFIIIKMLFQSVNSIAQLVPFLLAALFLSGHYAQLLRYPACVLRALESDWLLFVVVFTTQIHSAYMYSFLYNIHPTTFFIGWTCPLIVSTI